MEIRYVEWLDSSSTSSWTPLSELKDTTVARCISVGFVVAESEEAVVLMQSFEPARDDDHRDFGDHTITIPKFAITKQTTLREAAENNS